MIPSPRPVQANVSIDRTTESSRPLTNPRFEPRNWLAVLCLMLTALLITVTQIDAWAETTILGTSDFVGATSGLPSQPAVQAQFVTEIDRELTAAASRLPSSVDRLIFRSGLVRTSVARAVPRVLDSSAFRAVWRRDLSVVHQRLVTVLRNRSAALKIRGTALTIDVPVAVSALLAAAGLPSVFARALPEQLQLTVTILNNHGLRHARIVVRITDKSGRFLDAAVAILAFSGVTAARRRRRALQLGATAGVIAATVTWLVVNHLANEGGTTPLAAAAIKALTSPLRDRLAVTAIVLAAIDGATLVPSLFRRIGGLAKRNGGKTPRQHPQGLRRSRIGERWLPDDSITSRLWCRSTTRASRSAPLARTAPGDELTLGAIGHGVLNACETFRGRPIG
jgi:hypothetical protein